MKRRRPPDASDDRTVHEPLSAPRRRRDALDAERPRTPLSRRLLRESIEESVANGHFLRFAAEFFDFIALDFCSFPFAPPLAAIGSQIIGATVFVHRE